MQNDTYESTRVRRIPIHIEAADGAGETSAPSSYYHERPNNHHNNTSSVNINYRGPASSPSARHSPSSCQEAAARPQVNQAGSPGPAAAENDSKLVNSPEPIPLPPPPTPTAQSASNSSSPTGGQTRQSQPQAAVQAIKLEVVSLVNQISAFAGTSAKAREFRYLDEMLTQCNLKLDDIVCGDDLDLRQQRKAAVKMIDQATDVLMKKLQINIDIHNLSQSMSQP